MGGGERWANRRGRERTEKMASVDSHAFSNANLRGRKNPARGWLASAKIVIDYVKSGRIDCWGRFHNESGYNSAPSQSLISASFCHVCAPLVASCTHEPMATITPAEEVNDVSAPVST
jgi:hypothetical protein